MFGNSTAIYSYRILPLLIILLTISTSVRPEDAGQAVNLGFGLELILAKLEQLELKMITLEVQNRNLTEQLTRALAAPKQCAEEPVKVVQVKEKPPAAVAVAVKNENENAVRNEEEQPEIDESELYTSCSEVPAKTSAIYLIKPSEKRKPFNASCVTNYFGDGWTFIQHRMNGSVEFYRNWKDYKNGFGSLEGEFWYGLDKIHLLTSTRKHEIYFELVDHKGLLKTARYNLFEISSEEEGYAIKQLGAFSGNAGDALGYHKGMKFSTYDRDNDEFTTNCAKKYRGAWWYKSCYKSNLNGRYVSGRNDQSMCWNTFSMANEGLAISKIMIREL
ncbi:microfibril-associated glycoprotein 4-like [Toxorhynchites rutilus septentrionalis]|uniref:microfibril-associated glycoprotein 4-like n=1 Tax=Toxorhynchites rutilus septentrionalis TaxID=329112 RepID=UPI002478BC07|nr:microfibril-associated glycoprotein 4-like [Toxorhynchites rutilus septentrionalis]